MSFREVRILKSKHSHLGFAFYKVVAAGANPIQITRGIEKTTRALVEELKKMSKEVSLSFIKCAYVFYYYGF